jgi:hypothetical protein
MDFECTIAKAVASATPTQNSANKANSARFTAPRLLAVLCLGVQVVPDFEGHAVKDEMGRLRVQRHC